MLFVSLENIEPADCAEEAAAETVVAPPVDRPTVAPQQDFEPDALMSPLTALLLVAHGSRLEASNRAVAQLAERVAERAGERFALVDHAFLELAEPSIPQGIASCLERGASVVLVVPYFLAPGTHVAEDIPAEVEIARTRAPRAEIRITDYLGTADTMADLVIDLATER